jgi:cupin fold WbuC family metalloprotein
MPELIRRARVALATRGRQGKANGDDGAMRLLRLESCSCGREVKQGASMTQSEAPQLVGSEQLAPLLQAAAASTRKRSHLLLHADQQDRVQRLLIALEPESYVRPHVHGEQWEMIVLLRGRFDFLIFDPQAELVQRLAMSIASPVVQIPRGAWHSGVALAPETLVLEIKPGPYRPNEFAPWAPEEGEPTSGAFVHWAAGARVGSKWRSQVT